MAEAVVYTISDCPYCKAAKDDLRRRNVFYQEIDVAGGPPGAAGDDHPQR